MNTTTGAQRYNKRMDKIWDDYKRRENDRIARAAPGLLEAAKQVIWKLSHNHDVDGYKGPGRITREDATIKMLVEAIAKMEGK